MEVSAPKIVFDIHWMAMDIYDSIGSGTEQGLQPDIDVIDVKRGTSLFTDRGHILYTKPSVHAPQTATIAINCHPALMSRY